MARFNARYGGRCEVCGERFPAGTFIEYTNGRASHVVCVDAPRTAAPEPEPAEGWYIIQVCDPAMIGHIRGQIEEETFEGPIASEEEAREKSRQLNWTNKHVAGSDCIYYTVRNRPSDFKRSYAFTEPGEFEDVPDSAYYDPNDY